MDQAETVPRISVQPLALTINGEALRLEVAPWTTLLDLLRHHLQLTGTKKGCDHGQCGACTVLADGVRINACLTLALQHDGASITTIEGVAQGDALHPLQQAFIEHDAFQCGYCTPGQICSALGLIRENRAQSDADVRELMSGNLCRCGAYGNILKAVRSVMLQSSELGPSADPAMRADDGGAASAGTRAELGMRVTATSGERP
jgi:xanthine dehydrogenase YagT iron-sulfur-binding subunit